MLRRFQSKAGCLHADHLRGGIEERREQTDRVAPSSHARNKVFRILLLPLADLPADFPADDGLEIANHQWIRVRTDDRADDVERILHIRHPVAYRLARCILQRPAPGRDRDDRSTEHFHTADVQLLSLHVLFTHVHEAGESHLRGDRCSGNAVLSRPRLRDDPLLPRTLRQKYLSDRVVDLVRPRVAEVLPLKIDLPLSVQRGQTFGERKGRRPSRKFFEQRSEFRAKGCILLRLLIHAFQRT